MPRLEYLDGQKVFAIHEFLSKDECDVLIADSERIGYSSAPISTSGGEVMAPEIRNNARAMIDDPERASSLWEKARPFLPEVLHSQGLDWSAAGLNERLRFYRYSEAQQFRPHFDGAFARADGERSHLTFMIYLNDGCEGGQTRFYGPKMVPTLDVYPETGKALVFLHHVLHEGAPVRSGHKYVLRTDVMYRA